MRVYPSLMPGPLSWGMSRRFIRAPAFAVIALIVGICLAFHFWKSPEFLRGFWLEARGLVGAARTYQAYYADCTDGRAMGPLGFFVRKFVADDDADAVAFARSTLPACRLYMLQYRRRTYFEDGFSVRRRVDIDLGRY